MQSYMNEAENTPTYNRQNTFDISQTPTTMSTIDKSNRDCNDEGLFIIAKSKCEGLEVYAISEHNRSFKILPKYHLNTDKINIDTVKLFPVRDRIYISYIKDQRLWIRSWGFKRQTMVDVPLPQTVQYLKPRVTNAVGESFFISEEKYVTWPYEGYKTTVCKFGLESESYKCIELNFGGIKEMVGIGDELFVFNSKSEVFSFSFKGDKRMARGTLAHNGIIKAVVYRHKIYVGNYVQSKSTLFVEQFKKNTNQWITVM